MNGSTHAAIGVLAGVLLARSAHGSLTETLVLAGVCGFSALLPDVDHPNSRIRRRVGLAGDLAFGWMSHRGITHSVVAAVALGILAVLISPSRTAATAMAIGYSSHLVADFLTPAGVPLFAPLSWRRLRLPIITTGSLIEWALGALITIISLWLVGDVVL